MPEPRLDVLIVDDSPANLETLVSFLSYEGFKTRAATNGEIALRAIRAHPPDVVLLDVRLPGLDGFAVCQEIKKLPGDDIPVIFISASADTAPQARGGAAGGVDYDTTPFQPEEVIARVKAHGHLSWNERCLKRVNEELERHREHLEELVTERTKAYEEAAARERQQQQQLIQADKMASLGLMISGVAHEINSPNNLITINAELVQTFWLALLAALRETAPSTLTVGQQVMPFPLAVEHVDTLLKGIAEGSGRIKKITTSLCEFSRLDHATPNAEVSLEKVVAAAKFITAPVFKKYNATLCAEMPTHPPLIRGSHQKLEQVLVNLLLNACHAVEGCGGLVTVRSFVDEQRNMAVLETTDDGVGIPPENLPKIMDPFFTTKHGCGGTGLGLSISYTIKREHGGLLEFVSEVGKGTTARMLLPLSNIEH